MMYIKSGKILEHKVAIFVRSATSKWWFTWNH